MSDVAIKVENLSKLYRIGEADPYGSLRESVARAAAAPFRWFRHKAHGNGKPAAPPENDLWALKDVSFEVKRGEVLGIIGRNGAGKSTLLKVLSRITEPTSGHADLFGRVASLLEVGTGFHPELTGRENIFLNGAILGMLRAELTRKFDEIVAFSGVEKFIDTPVKRYSSGMYVRLAFAVAAHMEPEILIVDEVLAVGDAEFQKKCLGKMDDVAKSGRTVLFVSHQLGILKDICSHGVLMTEGRATPPLSIDSVIREYSVRSRPRGTEMGLMKHLVGARHVMEGTATSQLFFGDPLRVAIDLQHVPASPLAVTVAIKDRCGKRLSLFSTNPHDGVKLPVAEALQLMFEIDSCHYAPGEYSIDIAVTIPGVGIIEECLGALEFELLPRRVGGVLPYDGVFGQFFPPHAWQVSKSDPS